jgi:hypothetical protein
LFSLHKKEENDMRKTVISFSAVAFVFALGAAPVFAQMQGPGAENYGAGSGPQTGGSTQSATPQGQSGTNQGRGLYNSAGQPNNPAGGAPRANKNGAPKSNSIKH